MIIEHSPEAVIVGCTELPMLVKQEDFSIPILDTLELHCDA
jgi:aspartate racemase